MRPQSIPRLDAWHVCHSLLAWLIGLNIADLITTRAVLDRGGSESNPLMQGVIDSDPARVVDQVRVHGRGGSTGVSYTISPSCRGGPSVR
jgi:hypothetical protein